MSTFRLGTSLMHIIRFALHKKSLYRHMRYPLGNTVTYTRGFYIYRIPAIGKTLVFLMSFNLSTLIADSSKNSAMNQQIASTLKL